MNRALPILLLITLLVCGCDFGYGVRRTATINALPNLRRVKTKIESYPEIDHVHFFRRKGGQPLTLTGFKKAEDVFYLTYRGGENIHGTLMFVRNYKGEVSYDQSLLLLNHCPPQAWIDATWPVMKKIEKDLEENFGHPEIEATLHIDLIRVENPDRIQLNKQTQH